jgi:hypothetical protein
LKVLFIGNSHTYFNDMPALFARMCGDLTGERADVTMLAYSNRMLSWHCKEYFAIRFALLYGKYDYCVIQQRGHPVPPVEETEPFLERLVRLCASAGTKPVLYMTWAKKDEPDKAPLISGIYRALSEKNGTLLAPIAELFETLRIERPDIDLYWHDGSHASSYGSYLIAAALAAVVCKPGDLNALPDCAIDFRARFEKGEEPVAEENASHCVIDLDPEKASALRRCVERAVIR